MCLNVCKHLHCINIPKLQTFLWSWIYFTLIIGYIKDLLRMSIFNCFLHFPHSILWFLILVSRSIDMTRGIVSSDQSWIWVWFKRSNLLYTILFIAYVIILRFTKLFLVFIWIIYCLVYLPLLYLKLKLLLSLLRFSVTLFPFT